MTATQQAEIKNLELFKAKIDEEFLQAKKKNLELMCATQQAEIAKIDEEFPTFRDIAKKEFTISYETSSSAHVNTNHHRAKHTPMTVPEIRIDDSFWDQRIGVRFDTAVIPNETGLNSFLYHIIHVVIKGLGLESHLDVKFDVPIMDTAPDLIIRTKVNKIIIGTVQGKKPAKGTNQVREHKKIFRSNTAIAGEAFEQLCLCKIQLGTDTVGLISTLKGYQLLSIRDLSNEDVLTLDKAKSFFNSNNKDTENCFSDKTTNFFSYSNECQRGPKKRTKESSIVSTKREEKGPNKKTKNGRVSTVINNTSHMAERKYFASKVFNLGGNKEDNENVFKLLATFILLCVKSLENSLLCQQDYSKTCNILVRVLDTQNTTFNYQQVCLKDGIRFYDMPSKKNKKFYVIHQLGYGECGACCLACTEYSEPCVLKFFRHNIKLSQAEAKKAVEAEAEKWQEIYCVDYGFNFVEVLQINERNILVMPFLRLPDKNKREELVISEKNSLLYKALVHFSKKGYIHEDLWWRHVGVISVQKSQPTNEGYNLRERRGVRRFTSRKRTLDTIEREDVVVFCDLGGIVKCDDAVKREKWVNDQFQELKDRI